MIGFRNGREEGASFVRQQFFLLDNQVFQLFCLKDRLIILREDKVLGCRGSVGKLLAGHFLGDGSQLEEEVPRQ